MKGGREGRMNGKGKFTGIAPSAFLLTHPPSPPPLPPSLPPSSHPSSNSESTQIIIPASELKRHHDVYLAVVSSAHMVAAQGKAVIK